MTLLAVIAVSLAVCLGFTSLIIWLLLMPSGPVERLVASRLDRGDTVDKKLRSLKEQFAELSADVKIIPSVLDKEIQLLKNRVISFESKYGKVSKAEEQARLQKQIFDEAGNNSQNVSLIG